MKKTLEEVRSISRNLNPVPVDSQGLMVALTDLVERTGLQSRVICTFDCESPVAIEDNVVGTHLFHITQEALSNALRHALAREVRISLQQNDLQIALRIQDDGHGIPWPLPQREGLGQRIMKNRADMIGATLTIDRAKPKGTVVTCTLTTGMKHRACFLVWDAPATNAPSPSKPGLGELSAVELRRNQHASKRNRQAGPRADRR